MENNIDNSLEETLEELTRGAYEKYCEAVGGKAYNGDSLPSWEKFKADKSKERQVEAWKQAVISVLMNNKKEVTAIRAEIKKHDGKPQSGQGNALFAVMSDGTESLIHGVCRIGFTASPREVDVLDVTFNSGFIIDFVKDYPLNKFKKESSKKELGLLDK